MLNIHKRILLSDKEEWNHDICKEMDRTGDHYAKQNKKTKEIMFSSVCGFWVVYRYTKPCVHIIWKQKGRESLNVSRKRGRGRKKRKSWISSKYMIYLKLFVWFIIMCNEPLLIRQVSETQYGISCGRAYCFNRLSICAYIHEQKERGGREGDKKGGC